MERARGASSSTTFAFPTTVSEWLRRRMAQRSPIAQLQRTEKAFQRQCVSSGRQRRFRKQHPRHCDNDLRRLRAGAERSERQSRRRHRRAAGSGAFREQPAILNHGEISTSPRGRTERGDFASVSRRAPIEDGRGSPAAAAEKRFSASAPHRCRSSVWGSRTSRFLPERRSRRACCPDCYGR